jgi:hypothetical protein
MRFLDRFNRGPFSLTHSEAFSVAVFAANTLLFVALHANLRAIHPELPATR